MARISWLLMRPEVRFTCQANFYTVLPGVYCFTRSTITVYVPGQFLYCFTRSTITNGSGYYKVPLPPQRYVVTAKHPDFITYTSYPGFFVVPGDGYHTGNFFLTRK